MSEKEQDIKAYHPDEQNYATELASKVEELRGKIDEAKEAIVTNGIKIDEHASTGALEKYYCDHNALPITELKVFLELKLELAHKSIQLYKVTGSEGDDKTAGHTEMVYSLALTAANAGSSGRSQLVSILDGLAHDEWRAYERFDRNKLSELTQGEGTLGEKNQDGVNYLLARYDVFDSLKRWAQEH